MFACFFAVSSIGPRFFQEAVERRTIQNEIASSHSETPSALILLCNQIRVKKNIVFLSDSRDLAFDSDVRSLALCNADGAGLWGALFPGIAQRF